MQTQKQVTNKYTKILQYKHSILHMEQIPRITDIVQKRQEFLKAKPNQSVTLE